MDKILKKCIPTILLAVLLLTPVLAAGQAAFSLQSASPQQMEGFKKLSPDQQKAITEEISKSGGNLTPEAMEALKNRPEFQNLSPQDIVKGKEMLEKQEAVKKEAAKEAVKQEAVKKVLEGTIVPGSVGAEKKKGAEGAEALQLEKAIEAETSEAGRKIIGEETRPRSLYDRAREIRKYQDISLDLQPFGYEFFREAAVRILTERRDIPVPLKYLVGPGDEVRIALWGRVNASYNLTVDRDGKITIPTIGPLTVAGMTFEQMSQFLIKQAEQITGTNVDVSMGALRTIPVFILGDVRRPGAYTIGAFATITDALLLAGGPTEIGTMRNIQLKRKDKVIQTFDLYDLLLKGDKSHDVTLQAGDIVFVPVIGPYVGVAGNVKRPALYELKDDFSLERLFDLAGGIIPAAYTQQIQVERTIKNEKKIIVDIDDKSLARTKSVLLQDADLVKVFSIVERDVNVVYLNGNVKKGGKYALTPGMRIKDVLKDEKELLPETYFDYALIKRQQPPGMETVLIPFNLGSLLLKDDRASNLELRPLDSIYVFNKWFFRDKPFFTVSGEVRRAGKFDMAKPGDEAGKKMEPKSAERSGIAITEKYELLENFRVKDAILTAGGLTKDAYLKKGEIIRVDERKEYRTLYFNVAGALAGDPAENILLRDEDQIIIHSLYEEKWKETVTVSGEIKNPGDVLLTEKMRVSDLFFKAGGQTRDTLLDSAELYRTDWKTKEVTLRKINLAAALRGDPAENPELQDLDRLVVHSIWEKVYKKSATVEGEVLKPGAYQMAGNMTVRDLVFAAGNVLESASMEEAEISSQIIGKDNQASIVHKEINLGKALAGDPAHNLPLQPYDRLFIKRITNWRHENYVTVTGEFKYPGRYIIEKGERLSSLIDRAGGFKDTAYLRGAVFARERVRQIQQESLLQMADRLERELLASGSASISTALSTEEVTAKQVELEQKQKFIESLRRLKATGRMTLHLAHLRLLKNSQFDIELEDGDTLFVPQQNSVVTVVGAVMSQGSYVYLENMGYQDYIDQTGGYSRFADTDNVFVLKVDGSARKLSRGLFNWSPARNRWELANYGEEIKPIEAGDTIVVPEKVERIAWLREIKDITQIMMNAAVTAGVVLKLF